MPRNSAIRHADSVSGHSYVYAESVPSKVSERIEVRSVTTISRFQVDNEFVTSEFRKHSFKWRDDTKHISSPTQKYLHPSYARIIGLGPSVIKLLLESLRREPDDWFYALRAVSGANPVTTEMAGFYDEMTEAWLQWGRSHDIVK